jgi:hypothetical protein
MTFQRPSIVRAAVVLSAASFAMTGCLAEGLEVPIAFETPSYEFSVTEEVEAFEDDVCADAESRDCKIIIALDQTDDGEVSDPPRIPDTFPNEVTIEEEIDGFTASTVIDLEEWAANEGLETTISGGVAMAFEVDLTQEADVQAEIETPDLISNVDIQAVAFAWLQNSLTFDLPSIQLHVADGLLLNEDESNADAAARLMADNAVTYVGTLDETPAGSTEDTNFNLASGGSDTLKAALQSLQFTVVLTIPEDLSLLQQQDNGLWTKPQGEGEVAMKAEITYTVSPSDVQGGFNF